LILKTKMNAETGHGQDELYETLQKQFGNSVKVAAKNLGCSIKALRNICRRMGITRWPYRTKQTAYKRQFCYDFQVHDNSTTSQPIDENWIRNNTTACTEPVRRMLPSFTEFLELVGLKESTN
jgi:hypothetical protein